MLSIKQLQCVCFVLKQIILPFHQPPPPTALTVPVLHLATTINTAEPKLRRLVNPVDGRPGRVSSFKKTKKIFEVKYYEDTLPTPGQKKRAKNVLQIDGKEALLPLLLL